MFGSNYAENFGLPGFPWTGMDPQGGMLAPAFSGMEGGQPVPGTPGGTQMVARADPMAPAGAAQPPAGAGMGNSVPGAGIGQSVNPSVPALQSGSPLAIGAGSLPGVGGNNMMAGAGASPQPGAGAPALSFGAGRGAV